MRSLVRLTLTLLAVLVCLSSLAPPAGADGGLRGGFSDDPDQILFGGQLELDPLGENIYFVPSAEAGFGNDLFSLSFNGDFQYRFDTNGGVRPPSRASPRPRPSLPRLGSSEYFVRLEARRQRIPSLPARR